MIGSRSLRQVAAFPSSVGKLLHRVQRGFCASCGQRVRPGQWSVDHVIPLALGGADAFGNFAMVHGRCNTRKADRMPTGCELIWLMAVNARLGVGPQRMAA